MKTLERAVRKTAKGADAKALASSLGDLVLMRLRNRKVAELNRMVSRIPTTPAPRRARSTRRRGRNQPYTPTGKPNIARLGTWRHYMVKVICANHSTWAAEAEHSLCDEPKFAKNRLDFSWAAANGYIDFV